MIVLMFLGLLQAHARHPAVAPPKPAVTRAKPAPEQGAPALPASWEYRDNKDPAKGVVYSSISTRSAAGYRLVVRCDKTDEHVVSVQFIPNKDPGGSPDKLVTVMPETGPAVVVPWEFPGSGAFNRSSNLYSILNAIAQSKHLRVATTNSAGEPISEGFDGPGGDAPIKAIYADCGLTYGPPPPPPAPTPAPAAPVAPAAKP